MALLIIYPWLANDFFTVQIGAYSFILGTIAMSLMILAGYGGMVSLAQLTVAGVAAYMVPIFGTNAQDVLGFGWPWWFVVPLSLAIGTLVGTLVGLIAVRTSGIYTIMITLAIAVSIFFFARQNYIIFNGFTGFSGIGAPVLLGTSLREPIPFYYLCLVVAGGLLAATVYAAASPYGMALKAVRDNPRRMRALGFNVTAIRVSAFALAGFVASAGGLLLVLLNGRISPGTIGVDVAIDVLVIAVIGGLSHPIGAFLGAVTFILLENFAIDLIDRERFNTVIGTVFLVIVLFSPDGLLGLWRRFGPGQNLTNHQGTSSRSRRETKKSSQQEERQ
jgi:branched-chain amino acid transport system permease protein